MTEEFDLSEKIKDTFFEDIGICSAIPTSDVKEFIKRLRKKLPDYLLDTLDKLSGDKLK